LARHAGVHLYNDRDDTLYASRSFLTVSANGHGSRLIRLPNPMDVYDAFSGERVQRGVGGFAHDLQDKETVIWRLS
jgi:hypothetical protein